jgi:hypothetical protein
MFEEEIGDAREQKRFRIPGSVFDVFGLLSFFNLLGLLDVVGVFCVLGSLVIFGLRLD